MKRIYLLPLILLLSNLAFSQNQSSLAYQALADSLLENHNYQHAASYYEKALKNASEQGEIMLKIATCYYKINKMKDAEVWYQKAEANHAVFSNEDVYKYVNVLRMIEKRPNAQKLLVNLIKDDPDALYARQMLDDLLTYKKYYKDSLGYSVLPLSINTQLSEFAPAFYKDGIVYSSGQSEHLIKQKYHYDNTNFLNLYYSAKIRDTLFRKPTLFENNFNARFHDGPATFYDNDKKMILNRNQLVSAKGEKDLEIWHLTLYEGVYVQSKSNWQLKIVPFSNASYSIAHPSISADGNVLYFISDMPGGYGGTDIYKVLRTNGTWGEPLNLGSAINTPGNEEFPFYSNKTLYFASNGRGGLGGLDIFKSQQTVNGFSAPDNLGYPINTNHDDFAFISMPDGKTGYFSSNRKGNDDLYTFKKSPDMVQMVAHIYDGVTKDNLAGAELQLMADTGFDTTLYADDDGLINFQLERETAYIIIGSKDGKSGMHSGFASTEEDRLHITHQIAANGDTTRIPCIGLVQNTSGINQNPAKTIIIDEKSGKVVAHAVEHSLVSFLGEKGHTYSVEIQNRVGDTTVFHLNLHHNETEKKTWTMTLKDEPKVLTMAAHVVTSDNNQSLAGAQVKIITFAEADQELITDDNGNVDFILPNGAAYILMADKGNLTGMHSGIAEPGTDKATITHNVSVHVDQSTLPVGILITDHDGNVIEQANAVVTERITGNELPLVKNDGVLTFQAERGKEYEINITKNKYQSVTQLISIPADAASIEKINIFLLEKVPVPYQMAARVFKASDKSPLAEAQVRIITFSEDDQELVTNEEGIVEFTLPEGTAYVVMGTKDGLTGMHSGVVEPGTDKLSIIHPVAAEGDYKNQLPVFGIIANEAGEVLVNSEVVVTEKSSSQKIPVKFHDGILTFYGVKGKNYTVTVNNDKYFTASKQINIPLSETSVDDFIIALKKNPDAILYYNMAARVFKASDNTALADAKVKIITFSETDQDLVANSDGIVDFKLPEGTAYVVLGKKDGLVGMHSGVAEAGSDKLSVTHPVPAQGNPLPLIGLIINTKGEAIKDAQVKVSDKATGNELPVSFKQGIFTFLGDIGRDYRIAVTHKDYQETSKQVTAPQSERDIEKFTIVLEKRVPPPVTLTLAARIFKASDKTPLPGAQVKIITFLADDLELVANKSGVVEFKLLEGTPYVVLATRDGLTGMHSDVAMRGTDKNAVIHRIYAQGDSKKQIPIFGLVANKEGDVLMDSKVSVVERGSNENILVKCHNGIMTFFATKGKSYKVTADSKDYKTGYKDIPIPLTITSVEDFILTLEKISTPPLVQSGTYPISARVLNADNTPLPGAEVKVITFSGTDVDLVTDDKGTVEFSLKEGTPYVIVGSKDNLSGTISGIAGKGSDKGVQSIVAKDDSKNRLPVFGLIANKEGDVLTDSKVAVVEKSSGKSIPVQFHEGILTFYGDKGKDYTITVDSKDYRTTAKELSIPLTKGVKDFIITLERSSPPVNKLGTYTMAARVFKAIDNTPLSGANVKIITFSENDIELIANEEGLVEFNLEEETPYVIIGSKDDFLGSTSGVVGKGIGNASMIHLIPAQGDSKNKLPVFGLIANKAGDVLADSKVTVVEKTTSQDVPVQFHDGILTFYAEKGKDYTITVDSKDYQTASKQLSVPLTKTGVEDFIITLEKTSTPTLLIPPTSTPIPTQSGTYAMAARVFKESDNTSLPGANVKIITFSENDIDLVANENGVVEFTLDEGTPYVIMGSKDDFLGTTSGIVGKGSDKVSVIHPISAQGDSKNKLPVFGLIANKNGDVLTDSKVVVTEGATGKDIPVQFHDGILTFYGDKGRDYTITVENKEYQTAFKKLNIPLTKTGIEDFIITLEKDPTSQPPQLIPTQSETYAMAARVFKGSDNTPLPGADVKIITFSETDVDLVANDKGIVEFTLAEGTPYVLIGSKDDFLGTTSGIVGKGSDKTSIIHPIVAQNDSKNKRPVFGLIADKTGNVVADSKVTVTEKSTGTNIPVQFHDGILTFFGEKGKDYIVSVDSKDYITASKEISIPASGNLVEDFIITLEKVPPYIMAARVFKAADNTALASAQVKVITFSEKDQELTTNSNGVVEFLLPQGTAYVVMASKDGFSGMHAGIAEPGTDKKSITHDIPALGDVEGTVQVLGFISTENGQNLASPKINIVDETTGKKVDYTNVMGIVAFMGEQGHTYKVQASASGFPEQTKTILVDANAKEPIKWQWKLTGGLEDLSDRLVLFNNLTEPKRCFLVKNKQTLEIIEKDGMLYLQNASDTKLVCAGSLAALLADPKAFVNEFGIKSTAVVSIENIYFDFDKAVLDEVDEKELNKIAVLLQDNANWELQISTHTDDRGNENYNQRLSEKRAVSVLKYLNSKNVGRRLVSKAFGETVLAVPCNTTECTEEQHQKNRRAEFNLLLKEKLINIAKPIKIKNPYGSATEKSGVSTEYFDAIESLGSKQVEGVVFKINIGAYRYNSTLEFQFLKDLGSVESTMHEGITYYSLAGFATLSKAEAIKTKVIERGIADASISIYYNGKRISLKEFKLL